MVSPVERLQGWLEVVCWVSILVEHLLIKVAQGIHCHYQSTDLLALSRRSHYFKLPGDLLSSNAARRGGAQYRTGKLPAAAVAWEGGLQFQ